MRFSTIFTVLAAGAMAFAAAIPADKTPDAKTPDNNTSGVPAKNDVTNVQQPFTDLSNKCDTIFPKFDSCSDDSCSSEIVDELVAAIGDCANAVGGLAGGSGTSDLATSVSNVVNKITTSLSAHKDKCGDKCPGLMDTYAKVDQPLSACLDKAFGLYTGLADLVSKMLSGLASTLKGINFTSVLKVCKLA